MMTYFNIIYMTASVIKFSTKLNLYLFKEFNIKVNDFNVDLIEFKVSSLPRHD